MRRTFDQGRLEPAALIAEPFEPAFPPAAITKLALRGSAELSFQFGMLDPTIRKRVWCWCAAYSANFIAAL
jgi:hypothetical protein